MIETYSNWISKMFYPNITLGTVAAVGIPYALGALTGHKWIGLAAAGYVGYEITKPRLSPFVSP